jgi:hypothetical protein
MDPTLKCDARTATPATSFRRLDPFPLFSVKTFRVYAAAFSLSIVRKYRLLLFRMFANRLAPSQDNRVRL